MLSIFSCLFITKCYVKKDYWIFKRLLNVLVRFICEIMGISFLIYGLSL
jgi:hypothetical protein